MKKYYNASILIIGFLFNTTVQAQSKKFKIEEEPFWITVNPIDYGNTKLDHEAEDGYMDISYEKQVSLTQQTTYFKKAIRILSEAGVQNRSEITIEFDPSYEQLTFHSIRIMRNGKWINKLKAEKIKVIQQETELDRHLYNQSLSAILVLEDVRKSDIIEYSYSIKGFNTIFNGKYADSYGTAFSVPVNNLYYKVIIPSNKEVIIKYTKAPNNPGIKKSADETIYEWILKDVHALHVQDKLPSWFDPYPSILLSEYKDWKEVNNWALQLFPRSNVLTPELEKKISEIRMKNPNPRNRVLEALRFVQDDIRYMGFEMGESSHKPFPPGKIIDQRFGDCKDKSYLLCTILRAMNIEASPVLIGTGYKKTIKTLLPSPTVFDHVTVQVKLDDNTFYFDPTIQYQRGDLDNIFFPDYQCGLVINENSNNIIDIPMQEKGMVKIKEIFDIPDMFGKAQLKVKTSYSGSFADDIRSSFQNNSHYEMLKKFRDYYAPYFEKIKGDSLHFEDDEDSGIFTTEEFYSISDLWKIESGKKKAQFESFVINGIMNKPADLERQMPFYISFPAIYSESIEINVPEEWKAIHSSDEIKCDNFFMKTDFSYSNRKFLLKYEYKTLTDNVSPEEAPFYLESYDKVNKSIAYTLTWGYDNNNKIETQIRAEDVLKSKGGRILLSIGLVVIMVIGIIIWRIWNA